MSHADCSVAVHCEAIAHGYEFATAKGSVLYYRQRENSLLRAAQVASTRTIPFSQLFEPRTFIRTCASDYARFVLADTQEPPASVRDDTAVVEAYLGAPEA